MKDRVVETTVRIDFQTNDADGVPVAPSSAFAASDFRIYKDGSATQKATTNGITVTSPFDSVVGDHLIEIDTSNDTGDDGFWALGSEYRIKINSAKTVDGQVQTGVKVGEFRLVSGAVELDTDAQAMVTAFNAMRSGNVYTAPALANAPSGGGGGGDATLANQEEILARLSTTTISVTGYAQLDSYGVLQLKRGHTATLTFTSSTSNIVSDLSASTTKVFFGVKDAAGRSWLSIEGTKLVNTGLQSVRFSITAALAAAMINGEHFFDVVAVYEYNASNTPKYTSLQPFTSGRAKVTDLYVDI